MIVEYERKQFSEVRPSKIICDECGKECIGTICRVQLKWTFSEAPETIKDLCWECGFKLYPVKANRERKDKEFELQMAFHRAEEAKRKGVDDA